MSAMQAPPLLPGSHKFTRPLKECSTPGCGPKDPSGGVELGSKFFCASCWRKRNARKKTQ